MSFSQPEYQLKLPPRPIFLTGPPRSGTTLLQTLIGAHPAVLSFPETHFFPILVPALGVAGDLLSPLDPGELNWPVFRVKTREMTGLELPPGDYEWLLSRASSGEIFLKDFFELIVRRSLLRAYGPERLAEPGWRWLEKTPWHMASIPLIRQIFPEAQFLFITRHPLFSIDSAKRKIPHDFSIPYDQLAAAWQFGVTRAGAALAKWPEATRWVRYEDFAANPRAQLSQLEPFLELELDVEAPVRDPEKIMKFFLPDEDWKLPVLEGGRYRSGRKVRHILRTMGWREFAGLQIQLRKSMAVWGYRPLFPVLVHTWRLARWMRRKLRQLSAQ